ncbi:MAG TPA: zinc-binding dehydrogenase [Pyrinomonadaceae bacterium]|nr:zinc-binding dehydrogenase [Pyrinomonadaceae bacterium]
MKTSRAAVLTNYEAPLELKEFPIPESIEPGAALVKVKLAGICGTDVHLWHGQLPIPLPVILGHETVGVIEEVGEGLTHDWSNNPIAAGDRITWSSSINCNECYYCRVKPEPTRCLKRKAYGISYDCSVAPHLFGGYADYIYLRPGTAIFKIPEQLPTEAVVGAGCALVTSLHGIERIGVRMGDNVVIQGSGPVGLACLAVAKAGGAAQIIIFGGPPHRLQLATRFGADVSIDVDASSVEERKARVMELTGGFGADVVLECVGIPQAVTEGVELCRDGGRYLVLGHYGNAGTIPFNPHIVTRKQLTMAGSWGFEPRHTQAALKFLSRTRDQFPFEQLVSTPFPLDRAFDALQATASWSTAKSAIAP